MIEGIVSMEPIIAVREGEIPFRIYQNSIAESGIPEGPAFLLGTFSRREDPSSEDEAERLFGLLREACPKQSFLLAVFEAGDWDRDFSPWPAAGVLGRETFAGGGGEMLERLKRTLIPTIETLDFQVTGLYPAGYSLAGLFALWALYEEELFSGAVCCSGSLWYPQFLDYAQEKELRSGMTIYLSLGGKEEKSPDPVVSTIGNCARTLERFYKKDPHVAQSILEWNSGGHFADSGKRLAKGMAWMLAHTK